MSNEFGRGRPPRRETSSDSRSGGRTRRSTNRQGLRSTSEIGPALSIALASLVLVAVSGFLPWSYPKPDQNWLERLFSLDVEVGPRMSGFEVGFGQSAAFTAGVALLFILVGAATGAFPRALTSMAILFSILAAYHVLNGFRDVARGELWWLENDDLRSRPASEATWETFVAMAQNAYGVLAGTVAVLVACGASAELLAMANGAGSIGRSTFDDSEWKRLSVKVSIAFVLGFVWIGTWWWATFALSAVSLVVWIASGRRFDELTARSAVAPIVALGGLVSAMHAFFYR